MPKEPRFRLHIHYKSGRTCSFLVKRYNITWDRAEQAVTKYEWTYADGYKGPRPVFAGMTDIESIWVEDV